jgi:hypothetical protein
MIETDYHILPEEVYLDVVTEAMKLNVSVDYFLMEFCKVDD